MHSDLNALETRNEKGAVVAVGEMMARMSVCDSRFHFVVRRFVVRRCEEEKEDAEVADLKLCQYIIKVAFIKEHSSPPCRWPLEVR